MPASPANAHPRAGARLIIVALFALFTALAGLWSLPPLDRDEARFAQASAQMLETGDFLVIRFQDRERNKKPAGIYWLQAASVSAFSSIEAREIWAYRIPSVIGAVLAAIFTFYCARRLYGPQTALLAAMLLAAAPVMAAEATIAKTDGVLLALICLAQWAFVEIYARHQEGGQKGWRFPIVFWTAQGAAVLIKGPIGPMISLLTGAGLITGRPRFSWIGAMRPVAGTLILLILIAPWAIAIGLATEGRFFTDAIGQDMLGKVGSVQESHAGPPGYHSVLVWALFWPAAALILPGLVHIWRDRAKWQARFLLAWLVPSLIVFEIAATKLPHYVLPLYPALAIIAAHAAERDLPVSTWPRRIGALIYAGVGLFAAGLIAVLPIILSEAPLKSLCFAAAALTAAATLLIALLFWRGRAFVGGVAAAILSALFAWTLMNGVLPGLSKLAVSPRLSTALEQMNAHPIHDGAPPVAIAGYSEPSAVFLIGTDTALTTGEDAARRLARGEVELAIVEAREAEAFAAQAAREAISLEALAVIDGLNYSNGDSVSLTIFARQMAAER